MERDQQPSQPSSSLENVLKDPLLLVQPRAGQLELDVLKLRMFVADQTTAEDKTHIRPHLSADTDDTAQLSLLTSACKATARGTRCASADQMGIQADSDIDIPSKPRHSTAHQAKDQAAEWTGVRTGSNLNTIQAIDSVACSTGMTADDASACPPMCCQPTCEAASNNSSNVATHVDAAPIPKHPDMDHISVCQPDDLLVNPKSLLADDNLCNASVDSLVADAGVPLMTELIRPAVQGTPLTSAGTFPQDSNQVRITSAAMQGPAAYSNYTSTQAPPPEATIAVITTCPPVPADNSISSNDQPPLQYPETCSSSRVESWSTHSSTVPMACPPDAAVQPKQSVAALQHTVASPTAVGFLIPRGLTVGQFVAGAVPIMSCLHQQQPASASITMKQSHGSTAGFVQTCVQPPAVACTAASVSVSASASPSASGPASHQFRRPLGPDILPPALQKEIVSMHG